MATKSTKTATATKPAVEQEIKKEQTAVAEVKKEAVATAAPQVVSDARPSFLKEGSKRGSENVTHKDLVIPRLEIVQSLSPARKRDHADYIEGAEEGMLYNSVTRELYGDEVLVVPCYYLKEWLVWKDRKKGGGFRGAFPTEAAAKEAIAALGKKDDRNQGDNPADFTAMDTAQHFCLIIMPNGKVQQIVLSMSKSKMKVSRKWNSMISLSDDDSFAKAYKVEAVNETNANGEDYYNLKIVPSGYVSEAIYNAGEAMHTLLKAGGATADRSGMDEEDHPAPRKASSDEF